VIEDYRIEYNTRRPHSKLRYQSPVGFAAQLTPSLAPVVSDNRCYSHWDIERPKNGRYPSVSNPAGGAPIGLDLPWFIVNLLPGRGTNGSGRFPEET
jgi:hypothetical protein